MKRNLSVGRFIVCLVLVAMLVGGLLQSPTATDAQGYGKTHVVETGENLFRIALRYGMTVDALAAANGITDPTRIYVGQVLTIPDGSAPAPAAPVGDNAAPAPAPTTDTPPAAAPIYHIVERGQTLASIALQYGMAWSELAQVNNIADPNTIFVGQRLIVNASGATDTPAVNIPQNTSPPPAAPVGEVRSYTVQRGDSLASIARQYGISWTTIARANNLANPNTIFAGQVLSIPAQDDAAGTYFEPTGGVPSAPAPTITTGKQIVVQLSTQQVFAYEDGVLQKQVTVSTGLPNTPTVTGNYRIYWKLTSQTMSGPGYYLPGVPYVMYFYQGYALHGTYWHNNFGQPMSHGCVNLPTNEAQWFFSWAEVGTPVNVRY